MSCAALAFQSSARETSRPRATCVASLASSKAAPTACAKSAGEAAMDRLGMTPPGRNEHDAATARPAAAYSNSFIGLLPAFASFAENGSRPTAQAWSNPGKDS